MASCPAPGIDPWTDTIHVGLQKKQASRQAGVSTASMGKYDKRLAAEKPDERVQSTKRRKFAPVSEAGGAEGQRVSALVDNILARRGTGVWDCVCVCVCGGAGPPRGGEEVWLCAACLMLIMAGLRWVRRVELAI